MNEIEKKIMRTLGPEYDHSAKPHVYFYDFADLIPGGDRPRYRNAIYISKRSKTALDTQDFHRRMIESDKAEFPREWEHYLKVRENLKFPKVDLLPGIDQATLMEMKALNLFNLEQLVGQNEFQQWAEMARRILNALSENGSKGRDIVQGHETRAIGVLGENRASTYPGANGSSRTISGGNPFTYQNGQEKGYPQASEVSWSFEVVQ